MKLKRVDLAKLGKAVELTGLFIACSIDSKVDKRWAINLLKKSIRKLEKYEVKKS